MTKIGDLIAKNISKTNRELAELVNAAGFTKPNGGKFTQIDVQGFYTRHYRAVGKRALQSAGKLLSRAKRKKIRTAKVATKTRTSTTTTTYEDDSNTLLHLILDAKLPDAKKLALIKATVQTSKA